MKLTELITQINTTRPSQYGNDILVGFVNEVEHRVVDEVLSPASPTALEWAPYTWSADQQTVLLIPDEHTDVYLAYVYAKIDFTNAETDRYNNDATMYMNAWNDFAAEYRRAHAPFTARIGKTILYEKIGANGNWYLYDPVHDVWNDSGVSAYGPPGTSIEGIEDLESGDIRITLTDGTHYDVGTENLRAWATEAGNSATASALSATSASTSATNARTSEVASASNASDAHEDADKANQYMLASKAFSEDAETEKDEAELYSLVSEGYALGTQEGADVDSFSRYYHKNARYYAGVASAHADNASTYADSASSSATSASTSAQSAYGYANSAALDRDATEVLKNEAQASATSASLSASNAQNSAQIASDSAESALASKNSASQSATSAQASASSASASATSASASATSASNSASSASASATSASESAQSASESAESAQASAESVQAAIEDIAALKLLGLYCDIDGYVCQRLEGEDGI